MERDPIGDRTESLDELKGEVASGRVLDRPDARGTSLGAGTLLDELSRSTQQDRCELENTLGKPNPARLRIEEEQRRIELPDPSRHTPGGGDALRLTARRSDGTRGVV